MATSVPPVAVDVWVADATWPELRAHATADDRSAAARYVRAADRDLALGRRGLVRFALRHHLGGDSWARRFDTRCDHCGADHGKPRLPGVRLDFSVSRSAHVVAVAVDGNGTVGLDIEHADRAGVVLEIAPTFLADEELRVLAALSDGARTGAALASWTAKEAVTKASGHGVAVDFRRIVCDESGNAFARLPRELAGPEWQVTRPELGHSVHACVVTDRPVSRLAVHRVGDERARRAGGPGLDGR